MKKLNQTSHILYLVALAFFIKAYLDAKPILNLIGAMLLVMGIVRQCLLKKAMSIEEEVNGEDSLIKRLKSDMPRYCEMLFLYQQGNCDVLYEEGDGILIYDPSTKQYMATADSLVGAEDIIRKVADDYETLVVFDTVFEQLEGKLFRYQRKQDYYNYWYGKKEKFILPETTCTFRNLTQDDIAYVKQCHRVEALCKDEYIYGRMEEGMLGIFVNGTLAGFIGRHDNGSIGMLEVLEEYREKSIGMLLEMKYINDLLDVDDQEMIFTQINPDNEIAMHLQEKLGFIKAKQKCTLYFR